LTEVIDINGEPHEVPDQPNLLSLIPYSLSVEEQEKLAAERYHCQICKGCVLQELSAKGRRRLKINKKDKNIMICLDCGRLYAPVKT
jgi:hypothetical protein